MSSIPGAPPGAGRTETLTKVTRSGLIRWAALPILPILPVAALTAKSPHLAILTAGVGFLGPDHRKLISDRPLPAPVVGEATLRPSIPGSKGLAFPERGVLHAFLVVGSLFQADFHYF